MRRAVLHLLVLAVILPATAMARPSAPCGAMAQVAACCCARRPKPAVPPQTTLRDQCCALVHVAPVAARPAATVPGQVELSAFAAPAVALPALTPPAARPVAVAARALAPPPLDRSLFSTRCALLL